MKTVFEMGFDIENGILRKYTGNAAEITIPEEVTVIGDQVFWGYRNIEKIVLPNGLKQIGKDVFVGCDSMKKINIPDSVTKIGEGAFQNCGIEEVQLPKNLKAIQKRVFSISKLKSVVLPEKILTIGESAFEHCFYLEQVALPAGLRKIGSRAFYGSDELKKINLNPAHTEIASNAFGLCDMMADNMGYIVIRGVLHHSPALYKSNDIMLPETVKVIPHFAMTIQPDMKYKDINGEWICEFCKRVHIPKSVEEIQRFAFSGSGMQELFIEAHVDIPELAFSGCTKLKKITVPKGTVIHENAFGFWPKDVKMLEKIEVKYI